MILRSSSQTVPRNKTHKHKTTSLHTLQLSLSDVPPKKTFRTPSPGNEPFNSPDRGSIHENRQAGPTSPVSSIRKLNSRGNYKILFGQPNTKTCVSTTTLSKGSDGVKTQPKSRLLFRLCNQEPRKLKGVMSVFGQYGVIRKDRGTLKERQRMARSTIRCLGFAM